MKNYVLKHAHKSGDRSMHIVYSLLLILPFTSVYASSGVWLTQGIINYIFWLVFLFLATSSMIIYSVIIFLGESKRKIEEISLKGEARERQIKKRKTTTKYVAIINILIIAINISTYFYTLEFISIYITLSLIFLVITITYLILTIELFAISRDI